MLLCVQTGTQTLFGFFGQRLHGRLGDDLPLATRNRTSRFVEACNQVRTQQLALLPQEEGLSHRILGLVYAASLKGPLDESLLLRGKGDFIA